MLYFVRGATLPEDRSATWIANRTCAMSYGGQVEVRKLLGMLGDRGLKMRDYRHTLGTREFRTIGRCLTTRADESAGFAESPVAVEDGCADALETGALQSTR